MQWLHNGKDLVVELNTEIPTKEPGTYKQQSNLLLVSGRDARVIDIGSQPAISPISDRIAYYAPEGVVAINPDKTGKAVLAYAPRRILFLKDELFWLGRKHSRAFYRKWRRTPLAICPKPGFALLQRT